MEKPALPSEQITRELLTILPLLNRIVAFVLRQDGNDETSLAQMRVISHLLDKPITLTELAKKRRISLQSASEQVQCLVERGWIVRETNPKDRRQVLLEVTDEGQRQYAQAREHIVETLNPLMELLTPDESAVVHQAILHLQRILSQHQEILD